MHRIMAWPRLVLLVAGATTASFAAAGEKPRIPISRETTRISAPLRKDGYPDFTAALNQRLGRGVTPENNAQVLVWRAMGPGAIEKEARGEYFRMLGIAPLAEKGDYFVPLHEIVRRTANKQHMDEAATGELMDTLLEQRDDAAARPWSQDEFPVLAAWLAANEKPLGLWMEASRRPRRYSPLVSDGKSLCECFLRASDLDSFRTVVRALTARAMLRLDEEQAGHACADLAACHRIARLKAAGPFLVDWLVGGALEALACRSDIALVHSGRIPPERLRRYLAELDRLGPMPGMADVMDLGERAFGLDSLAAIIRDPDKFVPDLFSWPANDETKVFQTRALQLAKSARLDWNEVFRRHNAQFDRIVQIMRLADRAERDRGYAALDAANTAMSERARKRARSGKPPLADLSPAELAGQISDALVPLNTCSYPHLIHGAARVRMESDLVRLALALAIYRADHGSYPARLDQLSPKYVNTVPPDGLADRPLHYESCDGGYLLYSVGVNGNDDGGRGRDHREGDEEWDDLVVRVPASTPPARPKRPKP